MSGFRPNGSRCASPMTRARATPRSRDAAIGWIDRPRSGRDRRSRPAAPARPCARSPRTLPARQTWRLVDNDLSLLARAADSARPERAQVTARAGRSRARPRGGARRRRRSGHHHGAARSRVGAMARAAGDRMRGAAAAALRDAELRRPGRVRSAGSRRRRDRRRPSTRISAATRDSGPRSDPTAAADAVARFTAVGYAVDPRDGRLGDRAARPRDAERAAHRLGGRGARARRPAVRRHHRLADAPARAWSRPAAHRCASVTSTSSRARSRDAPGRQIAVEQHLAVER